MNLQPRSYGKQEWDTILLRKKNIRLIHIIYLVFAVLYLSLPHLFLKIYKEFK